MPLLVHSIARSIAMAAPSLAQGAMLIRCRSVLKRELKCMTMKVEDRGNRFTR